MSGQVEWRLRASEGGVRRAAALMGMASALALATAAQAQGPTEVDELVVTSSRATTATKTETPIIETPQSISVVTAAQISDRGALTLQETLSKHIRAGMSRKRRP